MNKLSLLYLSWYCLLSLRVSATLTPSQGPTFAPTGAPYMSNRGYAMSSTCNLNGEYMESWVDGRMIPKMDCDPTKLYTFSNRMSKCVYETLDYDNTTFFGVDGKWTYQDRHNKLNCDSIQIEDGPYDYDSLPVPYDPYVFCADKCINYTLSGDGVCNSVYIAQADDTYKIRCWLNDCVGPDMTSNTYASGYWATGNTKESGRSIWFHNMSQCYDQINFPPTNAPTHSPTLYPTFTPTNNPTLNPTSEPTLFPTNYPTLNPTSEPTLLPTNYPTLNPTSEPTLVPTNYPTLNPTSEPTLVPTNYPTLNPTSEPTLVPTNNPTINPTSEPTLFPTNIPTLSPTNAPSMTRTIIQEDIIVTDSYHFSFDMQLNEVYSSTAQGVIQRGSDRQSSAYVRQPALFVKQGSTTLLLRVSTTSNSNQGCDSEFDLELGNLHHIDVEVIDGSNATLYIDGTESCVIVFGTTEHPIYVNAPFDVFAGGAESTFPAILGDVFNVDWYNITEEPTNSPTDSPTSNPTNSPTLTPTSNPTNFPTESPTLTPTSSPTESPTDSPTLTPTSYPTDFPTESPTLTPTSNPTDFPTESPTLIPTSSPTDFPTKLPTLTPTSSPTEFPTESPTLIPTSSPTESPTLTPTLNPTDSPTDSPTLTPTSSPTEFPTESPTLTPTSDPTDFPSESPTLTPTSNPTDFPTDSPTLTPTSSPTEFPTESPTLTPTSDPTDFPSESPTLTPTSNPTSNPTLNPSESPTNSPTLTPTSDPTDFPTESPTLTPTSNPTDFPTESPTLIPTSSPTDFPTKSPTLTPTSSPTEFPTESPTLIPTSSPTESPTLTPTLNPTDSPTDSPTLTPTSSPTESPTDSPTLTPTLNPTISPTNKPTIEPTISPTDMSTNTPTGTPTTLTPSSVPSYAPTGAPYMNNRGYAMSSTCAHNGDFMESWVDGRMIPEMDCDPLKLYSEQNQQTECTYETLDYDNTTFFGEDGKWTYQDRHNKWMCDSVEVADGPYAYSSLPLPYDPYVFCAEKCINYTHSGGGVCNSVYIAQADDTYALRCYMYDCVGPNMTSDNYTTGYWATGNTKESGRSIWFKDMSECSSAVDEYLLNTLSPTHSPTLLPTVDPTLSPTHSPTLLPTVDPTLSPTHSPTLLPTVDPTLSPTHSPTLLPTVDPTLSPTLYPSATPTNNPTYYPTPDPTNMPTLTPTLIPTYYPTEYPTITPSQTPTTNPTLNPTIVPTNAPTSFPTISPTYYPSNEPTMAPVPTISPTVYPTSAPFMSTRGYAMSSSCSHNGDFMESWVDGRMIPEMACDSSNLYTDQNKQESCSFETLDYDNTTFFAEDGKWTYQNKHNRLNCDGVQVEDGPFPYNTLPTPYDPYVFCAERCINYTASGAGVCNSVYISQSEDTYAVRCWLNDCVGPTLTSDEYLTGYWATGNTKESCRSIWFNDMPQCSLEVQQYVESTQQPTLYPTPAPTQQPTEYPSVGPTSAPTNAPTLLPTLYPSNQPTTMVPTKAPVLTPSPTTMPTLAPFISNKGYTMSSSCNVNGEFYTSEVDAREIPKLECSSTALYTEEYKKRTCFYETLDYDNTEFFAEDGKWTYQNQHNKLLCDNTLTIYGPYSESDLPEPYDPYVFCADKCIDYNIKDNTGTCNSVLITLSDDSHLLRCYLYDCVGPDMMSNTYDTGTWATGNTKESCRSIWFGDMANCIYSVENPTGAPTMNPTQVPTSIAPTKSPITPSPRPTLTRVPSVGPTYSPQTPTTPSPSSPTTSAPTHYQPSATPEPTTPQTSSSLGSQQLILYGSIIGGSLFLIILVVIVAICIHTYRKSKAHKRLQRNIIISNPTIL